MERHLPLSPRPNPNEVWLNVGLTPGAAARSVAVLGVLSAGVLLGTRAFWDFFRGLAGPWDAAPPVKDVLFHLNLGAENVIASWYASMLLLLVAVTSVVCFVVDRTQGGNRREQVLSYGWVAIAGIFALLSLDEMGSVHERMAMMSRLNPFGDVPLGWTFMLAPFIVAVAAFMVGFGWVHVRRVPRAFVLMTVGVAAFLSVPVQEYIEVDVMRAAGGEGWERPVGLLPLEEGAELLGALAVLAAALSYAAVKGVAVVRTNRRWMVAGFMGVALLIGLAGGAVSIAIGGLAGDDGNPSNWPPAALALIVALLCLALSRTGQMHVPSRPTLLGLGTVSLLTSAYVGGGVYYFAGWHPGGGRMAVAVAAASIAVIVSLTRFRSTSTSATLASLAILVLAILYNGFFVMPVAVFLSVLGLGAGIVLGMGQGPSFPRSPGLQKSTLEAAHSF